MLSAELSTNSDSVARPASQGQTESKPLPLAWLTLFGGLLAVQFPPVALSWWTEIRHSDPSVPIAAALFIVLGLIHLRKTSAPFRLELSAIGLVILFSACILQTICSFLCFAKLQIILYVGVVASLLWTLASGKYVRQWMPLLVLSFFLLPAMTEETKAQVSLPLQLVSTKLAVALAKLVIPITSSSHYYTVNGQTYDVAPGCSGLGMWCSLALCFAIWQVFERFSIKGYATAFLLVPVLTVALNVIRLAITAILGYFFSQTVALAWHANLEFGLLPLGCLAMFLCLRNARVGN